MKSLMLKFFKKIVISNKINLLVLKQSLELIEFLGGFSLSISLKALHVQISVKTATDQFLIGSSTWM